MKDKHRGSYRRGGLFMLPFIVIGLLIAYLLNAPREALLSIGVFGLGTSLILILIGNRNK